MNVRTNTIMQNLFKISTLYSTHVIVKAILQIVLLNNIWGKFSNVKIHVFEVDYSYYWYS